MRIERVKLGKKVASEDHFELINNRKVSSVRDLAFALEDMNEELFSQHVSKSHNDFSEWILDVYGEEMLAKKIRNLGRKKLILVLKKVLEKEDKDNRDIKRISSPKRKRDVLKWIGEIE